MVSCLRESGFGNGGPRPYRHGRAASRPGTAGWLRAGWLLGALLVLPAQPAPAVGFANPFEVEEIAIGFGDSVSNPPQFSDDFEDGVFASGFYTVSCGGTPSESGGALILDDPGVCPQAPGLLQQEINPQVAFSGDATYTATWRYQQPAADEAYGISFGQEAPLDFLSFFLIDPDAPPGLFAVAVDETAQPLVVLGPFSNAELSGGLVTFELLLERDGGLLIPTARFSFDGTTASTGPLEAGALVAPPGRRFGATVWANVVPEPGTGLLLGLGLALVAARSRRPKGR